MCACERAPTSGGNAVQKIKIILAKIEKIKISQRENPESVWR